MLVMGLIAKIRFRRSVGKESISSIARDLNLSRPTVRKHCRTQTEPIYRRAQQPALLLLQPDVERMRARRCANG